MPGTLVAFAGIPCAAARFVRGRGYDADISTVDIPVASFPSGFVFVEAKPGDILGAVEKKIPDIGAIRGSTVVRGEAAPPTGDELDKNGLRMVFAGTLCLAESQDEDWMVVVHPMFVVRVERTRAGASVAGQDGPGMLRVTLADERFFWGRGFMGRWSFNRVRGDGSVAPDSLKQGGAPYTLAEVADQAAAALPRSPALSAKPAEWTSDPLGPLEFARFSPGVSALAEVERRGGVEPPCLRLDGTVAFHRSGDGRTGYAPRGQGANSQDFPVPLRLWKQGRGEGYAIQATYPDDFVVVVGRERIATVVLDGWEPVLVVYARTRDPGASPDPNDQDVQPARGEEVGVPTVLPLTDETVRSLSNGKLSLDGLRRWVMQPPAFQDAIGLDEEVARMFRDQAWRLYRIPDVEKNRHLLPLLARAEVVAGRRAPVTVSAYRFKARHAKFAQGTLEQGQLAASRSRANDIVEEAERIAQIKGNGASFHDPGILKLGNLPDILTSLSGSQFSVEDLRRYTQLGRNANVIRDADPGLAAEYETELRAQAELREKLTGAPERAMLDIGKRAADLERQLQNVGDGQRDQVEPMVQNFIRSIQGDLRAIQRSNDDATTRARAGVPGAAALLPPEWGPTHLVNLDRAIDRGARVFSAELGIVELSQLGGWVETEGVPSPSDTRLLPKPVRVAFGATLRPKSEPPSASGATTLRGADLARFGDLKDSVTWFVRAYRRGAAPGVAEEIDIAAVPHGEGTVVPIEAAELVPLTGDGNVRELEAQAVKIARERFRALPVVRAATYVVARPWPVQCDGVVATVEIQTREGGNGFETLVSVGTGQRAPASVGGDWHTQVRPPRQRDNGDGTRREGLAP